jgi:hypothetical protein
MAPLTELILMLCIILLQVHVFLRYEPGTKLARPESGH